MGMVLEFNWFLVVASHDRLISKDGSFYTIKDTKRIYPIGFQIPLIIKGNGCIGLVKIFKTVIDEKKTQIFFTYTEHFQMDSDVAKHYFDRYLDFKRREKEINP